MIYVEGTWRIGLLRRGHWIDRLRDAWEVFRGRALAHCYYDKPEAT